MVRVRSQLNLQICILQSTHETEHAAVTVGTLRCCFAITLSNLSALLFARSLSEVSLPRIPGTSRRSKHKKPAGGDRSRSRGVSLPPAVPSSLSRASIRRRSSVGARDNRQTAAEGEQRSEREEEEEGESGRARGGADSAYGSDVTSPPVDKFRLTESEYFKPKEVSPELTAQRDEINPFSIRVYPCTGFINIGVSGVHVVFVRIKIGSKII